MITNSIKETLGDRGIQITWDLIMPSKSVDELKRKIGEADLVKHITWLKQKDVSITATTPIDPFTPIPDYDEINIVIRVYGEYTKRQLIQFLNEIEHQECGLTA